MDAGTLSLEEAIRACTIAASCGLGKSAVGLSWPLFTPGACLDALGRQGLVTQNVSGTVDPTLVQRLLSCAKNSDCEKFRSCFGGSWVGLTRCREGATCLGNSLASPQNSAAYFDCGAIGSTCTDLASGAQRACCNEKPCSSGLSVVTCQGTFGTWCHSWGAYFEYDCSVVGQVCTVQESALCQGKGAACDVHTTAITCQGQTATYCAGGRLSTFDCGKNLFRGKCAKGENGMPCVRSGTDCDPEQFLGTCQGNALRICVDGRIHTVDCPTLGFKHCDLPAGAPALCVGKL